MNSRPARNCRDTLAGHELLRRPAAWLGCKYSGGAARLQAAAKDSVQLCAVVVAELIYGAHRSSNVAKTLAEVHAFCTPFVSLPFDDRTAEVYGQIRADLAARGQIIGPNDLMIAAIALANGLTLVTHNTAEFSRVPGLVIEDWQVP